MEQFWLNAPLSSFHGNGAPPPTLYRFLNTSMAELLSNSTLPDLFQTLSLWPQLIWTHAHETERLWAQMTAVDGSDVNLPYTCSFSLSLSSDYFKTCLMTLAMCVLLWYVKLRHLKTDMICSTIWKTENSLWTLCSSCFIEHVLYECESPLEIDW